MPRKPVNVRQARVVRRAAMKPTPKKPYTKKAVDAAYREVQGKMRKEVTKLQKIKNPFRLVGDVAGDARAPASIKRLQDLGMKGRAARTKAISAASKKHGVPKSQITAKKPINPGEIASKMSRDFKKKWGMTAR